MAAGNVAEMAIGGSRLQEDFVAAVACDVGAETDLRTGGATAAPGPPEWMGWLSLKKVLLARYSVRSTLRTVGCFIVGSCCRVS